jgi:hypothetical protein
VVAILLAGPARAAVLPVRGKLSFDIGNLPSFGTTASFSVTVNATAGGEITEVTVPASVFATTGLLVSVTDPIAAPIEGLLITLHNAAGLFEKPFALVHGPMQIGGIARVCLFAACDHPMVPANLSVPLDVIGAAPYATAFEASAVNLTVSGAPWNTFSATFATGTIHGPASQTSTVTVPGGVIRLVTPIFISTSIPSIASVAAVGILDLHVVPEPRALLLVGAGLVALAAGVRAQRRRRPERAPRIR